MYLEAREILALSVEHVVEVEKCCKELLEIFQVDVSAEGFG